jgi:hypothetical protein
MKTLNNFTKFLHFVQLFSRFSGLMIYNTIYKGREIMKLKKGILLLCLIVISSLFLTSCKPNIDDAVASSISPAINRDAVADTQPINKPIATTPIKKENKLTTIAKAGENAKAESNSVQQTDFNSPTVETLPAFSSKQPKIMGLAINDILEKVTDKYGEPQVSYVMEDPVQPITVYEYEGFSVGFNPSHLIQFIDVSSTKVNPGLNGLRLGQTTSEALAVLGKPDTLSIFVVSYNTKSAILKLDINPKTKTIKSIKLFAVNES